MPLIEHPTLKGKMIPDEKGGWYWYKSHVGDWTPVKVDPANSQTGWPQGFTLHTHFIPAANATGEWGPEIPSAGDLQRSKIDVRVVAVRIAPDRGADFGGHQVIIGIDKDEFAKSVNNKEAGDALANRVATLFGVAKEDETR